jgi:hypothetical protein
MPANHLQMDVSASDGFGLHSVQERKAQFAQGLLLARGPCLGRRGWTGQGRIIRLAAATPRFDGGCQFCGYLMLFMHTNCLPRPLSSASSSILPSQRSSAPPFPADLPFALASGGQFSFDSSASPSPQTSTKVSLSSSIFESKFG